MTRTQYAIKGSAGDITSCEHCGRNNLKKTVILAPLDADGNPGDPVHFGVACAATAMRVTETRIRNEAGAADRKHAERVAWARESVAVYGAAEGDVRATAEIFFARNPHARGKCSAKEFVWPHLAEARALLSGQENR